VLARGYFANTVSASSNTSFASVAGTSFSTPLVAGGVALILQAHPNWNADKVRRALFQTADIFLATSYFDYQYVKGYGIIDVYAAIHFVHGDVNGDGKADGGDVQPFIDSILGINPDFDEVRRSDMNVDGNPTEDDSRFRE
jgi:subtilisin family serine protease